MKKATNKKFEAWDEAVKNNWFKGSPKQKNKVFQLLKDPTIYTYAFFRDKDGNPLKLYPCQDMIINDMSDRVIFCAANQIGKSLTLCCKALHFALHNPGKTVLMISRTLPQSQDLLREIKRLLNTSPLNYKKQIGDAENTTQIYFKHFERKEIKGEMQQVELSQSRIICVPATEAALGYAVDLALPDELGFYPDGEYFYQQILQPRTYQTKGQIIVFSNPNGQQGIFWKLWNDEQFSKYKFNFLDCPSNTREEYEKLRRSLTRNEFDSTVNAVFTSPEGGFLSLYEREWIQEKRPNQIPIALQEPIYVFFDFAKTQDRTVRVTGSARKLTDDDWADSVFVHEMLEYPEGTPYTQIIDEDLKQLAKEYGHQLIIVGWDNTGVGSGIEDFVKRIQQLGIQTEPVQFSLENKSRIYTLFKLLIEQKRITIPFVAECDKQLSMLRFKRSKNNRLQVHHENEKDRDDFPDALAGLCSLIVSPDNVPVTIEIIEGGRKGQSKEGDECKACEFTLEEGDEVCPICGTETVEEEEEHGKQTKTESPQEEGIS